MKQSKDRYHLGLLFKGKNPSACLVKNGKIVCFAEEERFIRVKHAENEFPIMSIEYCMEAEGIEVSDLESIAVGWDAKKYDSDYMKEFFHRSFWEYRIKATDSIKWQEDKLLKYRSSELKREIVNNLGENLPPIRFYPHHLCHAYSAYFLSGMHEANILTMDGHGEEDCTVLWYADGDEIKKLFQKDIPHSLGWFYTLMTKFLGFRPHDGEGKTMGLAAYGEHDCQIRSKLEEIITIEDEDYFMNPEVFYGEKDEQYIGFPKKIIELFGKPVQAYPGYEYSKYQKDMAYQAQNLLEEAILLMARKTYRITGSKNFCLAGGTFMNCKANGVLAKQDFVENLFIIPPSGDNGISIGAALMAAKEDGQDIRSVMDHIYYGPEFSNEYIQDRLERHSNQLKYKRLDNISKEVAKLINDSMIVAWFQGRMEGGARALGNRSILSNPIDPKAKDKVNSRVKFREMWRPFCPSVTEERAKDYFDIKYPSQFMILAADAREGVDELLPAVVHIDNTVRPQEVSRRTNPKYWELIDEFGKLSGHPVILNTSFNIKGEPIICKPEEAINCLLNTDIDYLAMGEFLVWKTGVEYEP